MAATTGVAPGPGPATRGPGARVRIPLAPTRLTGWGGDRRWVIACLGLCVVVGVVSGVDPVDGIVAALGLVFLAVAFTDLTFAFVLFTVASFLDILSTTGSFSGTKIIGVVVFAAWLARLGTGRGRELGAFISENPGLTTALVGLLAWMCLSVMWATNHGAALTGTSTYAMVMVLIPIGYSAMRRREQATWVVAAFVVGALLSAVYGFVQPGSEAGRFTGANGDANGEATVLVAAIPLLACLYPVIRDSARLKLLSLIAMVIMVLSLFETLSREGLIGFGAVLVGAFIFGGRWRRQAAVLLALGALVTVGYYVVVAPATATQRVTMADTSGRSTLWKVAWRVIEAHPVLGVGNNNFIDVESRYINQPGAVQALYLVSEPKVAHNAFLEVAADLGIPGLLAFVAVLFFCLRGAVRAAWTFERLGDERMELIARGLVLSVVGILTTEMFVASGSAKYLWIPLAICPVLQGLAYRASRATASSPVRNRATRELSLRSV